VERAAADFFATYGMPEAAAKHRGDAARHHQLASEDDARADAENAKV
jgi:hypothetical protein